jgi:hypothetical protein
MYVRRRIEMFAKFLLGAVLLLLLLFTLAVFSQFPWSPNARALESAPTAPTTNAAFTPILGAAARSPTPQFAASVAPPTAVSSPSGTPIPSPSAIQAAMLPQTGADDPRSTDEYFVDPLFGRFYWEHGGTKRFGRPTGALMLVDGRQVQMFEHARLEYWPQQAGTPTAGHVVIAPWK